MTSFRTPVEIVVPPWKTNYRMKHLFIGSCFTENIGDKMAELKFISDVNPFGILYNPESISLAVRRLISPEPFTKEDLFFHMGLWHSYSHNSRFSSISSDIALRGINDRLSFSSSFLKQADFLFLTFGTAMVYELKSIGRIVANCHKVPASEFRRYHLSVNEIVGSFRKTLTDLWTLNPGIKLIFSVSPVRHLNDGAVENQLSKAVLLLSIDALRSVFDTERIYYFPSYELVMDELRDYRFYAEDMVHPSPLAVNFIWEKFMESIADEDSVALSKKIASLLQARNHRPMTKNSPEYQTFVRKTIQKIVEIAEKYPFLDFSGEKEYFTKELNSS